MRQSGHLFRKNRTIVAHGSGAHLHEIVKISRNHVHLFDLGNSIDRCIEGRQRRLARVGQPHFNKGDMIQPKPDWINQRPIPGDVPLCLKPPQPRLSR